jgi:ABC-type uncharacterized transport system ATPase subunit
MKGRYRVMYAIELEDIFKTFPGGVKANKNITLRIEEGEVFGLLGENGAGKSTLMNILYGLISRDSGRILIRGKEVNLRSPQDAIALGIGMVHQHFKLIPTLTVTENVVLGLEPILRQAKEMRMEGVMRRIPALGKILPIDFKGAAKRIKQISEENGMTIDPKAKIQDISVGLQQRVEIIKTLYREADILILDEPTSVLTPQEVDELFSTLEKFKKAGRTIILITHKLRETMALCDRIGVLRDGELVGIVNKSETTPEDLARMMVGRPVVLRVEKGVATPEDIVLLIHNLIVEDSRGLVAVDDVSFSVRAGEILGIAGVEGNGQTELVEALAGLRKPRSGSIQIGNSVTTRSSPREVRSTGVSHIPEDRQRRGLILGFTVEENLVLGRQYLKPFSTGPMNMLLNLQDAEALATRLVEDFSIRTTSVDAKASTLSGGNQQKVVVARELATDPKLILAAQPTRGLDVGSIETIHNILISMRDRGAAVLLVSAELDEITSLSDRILVMFDGKIVAEKIPEETTNEELGLLMAGHGDKESREEAEA